MSKYLSLRWEKNQKKALFYSIYINIFAILLRIPIVPLSIDKSRIWFYYKGDEVGFLYRRNNKYPFQSRWLSLLSEGSFNSLREIDQFWDEYFEYERKFAEKANAEFIYREANGLCNEPFCQIEGEHKKHNKEIPFNK